MEGMMRQLQCEMEALQLGCTADYRELGAQILAQADAETAQFEGRTETVKPERPLAVKANAALRTILHDEPESRQIGEGCECRGYQPFTYYTKSRIRIVVLPQDSPSAETYPNGTIYLTTGLLDSTLPYGTQNDAQLTAALAHELVHLRDGHVFLQWAFLRGRSRQNAKLAASKISGVIAWLPLPLKVGYTYETNIRFEEPEELEEDFEHAADLGAVRILAKLGYDPGEYLDLLKRVGEFRKRYGPGDKSPYGWIDERVACLTRLIAGKEAESRTGEHARCASSSGVGLR